MNLIEQMLFPDPFSDKIYLITTNSIVRRDGAVVMGRGIARQIREQFPTVPFLLGRQITSGSFYGLKWVPLGDTWLGAFQVKIHWGDQADLKLIEASTAMLRDVALARPNKEFHMNFPGIGNGRLRFADVLPIVQTLPDNVYLYAVR